MVATRSFNGKERVVDVNRTSWDALFIDGEWAQPSGSETTQVIDPSTEQPVGEVALASVRDVDHAVCAARMALPEWSSTPFTRRAELCLELANEVRRHSDGLARLITSELGMPLAQTLPIQVERPAFTFASMSALVQEIDWEERIGNSLIVREPAGVVGAITPWNFPLHQIAAKVAPALAAGCTVVLKPSEVTPLNALALADLTTRIGLPRGVLNVLPGIGRSVGAALAGHAGIERLTFTGSTLAGQRVASLAAQTVTPSSLELGGKSANVILDDANLDDAVPDGLRKCFFNSGQTCSALTRLLVPSRLLSQVEEIAVAAAGSYVLGDPLATETSLGPLVSKTQLRRVRAYIRKGIAEGATLITGGLERPSGLERGFFVKPTVFSNVDNSMTIAREEIFGPVLSIIPYRDESDAIAIANDSPYGLSGGVWSADLDRAQRIARQLQTGQVAINGGAFNLLAPFGGYKQSGYGRELGRFGLEEFLQVKAVQLPAVEDKPGG